ncbi:MAG: FAD:protein FMN transferase [Chloroflexi bacterium]|nr:FAD:protein FMN transferase [Chloroflexota bacterium]
MEGRTISGRFRAMNTDVAVNVLAEPGREAEASAAVQDVKRLFDRVEATLSRFRPSSDLSKLNQSAGLAYRATPMLREVLGAALSAAEATGGAFDPTVLRALEAAGYDRSFETVGASVPAASAPAPKADWHAIDVDNGRGTITLPASSAVDLGGIAKGWTVDKAGERLLGFASFAVDAGGDLRVQGTQEDGSPWTIGVQNPFDPENDALVLTLRDGAVATSTTARRNWLQAGERRHHIIDPRTGAPATSGVMAVTVISHSVMWSEVLAKAALVLGPEHGLALLRRRGDAEGLLFLEGGQVLASSEAFGAIRPLDR